MKKILKILLFIIIWFSFRSVWAYNISSLSYDSKLITTSTGLVVHSMSFNNDWTKLYYQWDSKKIYQYNLSTPYTFTGSTYIGSYTMPLSTSTSDLSSYTLNDLYTYILDYTASPLYIKQYKMSATWSISTSSLYKTSPNINSFYSSVTTSTFVNSTWTKIFLVPYNTKLIYSFNITTPFDISTLDTSSAKTFDMTSITQFVWNIAGITFSKDWTTLIVTNYNTPFYVYQFHLTTPFDLTTVVYDNLKTLIPANTTSYLNNYSLSVNDSWNNLFLWWYTLISKNLINSSFWSCFDGIKNQNETAVDYGGICWTTNINQTKPASYYPVYNYESWLEDNRKWNCLYFTFDNTDSKPYQFCKAYDYWELWPYFNHFCTVWSELYFYGKTYSSDHYDVSSFSNNNVSGKADIQYWVCATWNNKTYITDPRQTIFPTVPFSYFPTIYELKIDYTQWTLSGQTRVQQVAIIQNWNPSSDYIAYRDATTGYVVDNTSLLSYFPALKSNQWVINRAVSLTGSNDISRRVYYLNDITVNALTKTTLDLTYTDYKVLSEKLYTTATLTDSWIIDNPPTQGTEYWKTTNPNLNTGTEWDIFDCTALRAWDTWSWYLYIVYPFDCLAHIWKNIYLKWSDTVESTVNFFGEIFKIWKEPTPTANPFSFFEIPTANAWSGIVDAFATNFQATTSDRTWYFGKFYTYMWYWLYSIIFILGLTLFLVYKKGK